MVSLAEIEVKYSLAHQSRNVPQVCKVLLLRTVTELPLIYTATVRPTDM